ncbi:MAG: hypothetical protein OEW75_13325 [Cyclobacteriaceae bacterium]|nr:hypothetical protein [Cyclobacteriaceae bacterium]
MNNQKKKNGKLLIIAFILLAVVFVNAFLIKSNTDSSGIDRDLFKVIQTENINRVDAEREGVINTIEYSAGKWSLDGQHNANPLNIRLLFATVREISIRREITNADQKEAILEKMETEGKKMTFYANDIPVSSFQVWGDESNSTTFIKKTQDNEHVYLMEIPGYRAYIYGLLAISDPEWRHPVILNEMNWRNLSAIEVDFNNDPSSSFQIVTADSFYKIEGIAETDTSKLTSYIDYISLLEVDRYLKNDVPPDTSNLVVTFKIKDVGNNAMILKFWVREDKNSLTGTVNNRNWFIIDRKKTESLLRNRNYFSR